MAYNYKNPDDIKSGYGGCLLIFIVGLLIFLSSCHTTKFIDRIEIQKDTTSLHERDSILHVKKEDSVYYKNVIESMSSADVIFRDTGSVRIEYRADGSISLIEGQVRTLNNKLSRSASESVLWQRKFDSLAQVKTKDSIQVKTDYKTLSVTKKVSFLPGGLF